MDQIVPPVRLFGIPGSLRRESHSLAVLRGLKAELGPEADLRIGDVDLPLYNQDNDGRDAPSRVQKFREAIAASDGLIIATPEYNHGLPGVLKNALDWASRPHGQSALLGKPFLVISQSPGIVGGVRAQAQANETLLSTQSVPVLGPQIVLTDVGNKIKDGKLADKASLRFALSAIERMVEMVRTNRLFVL